MHASGGRRAEARLGSVGTSPSRIQALELAANNYYETLLMLGDRRSIGARGYRLFTLFSSIFRQPQSYIAVEKRTE
jgi:hypothetical protein